MALFFCNLPKLPYAPFPLLRIFHLWLPFVALKLPRPLAHTHSCLASSTFVSNEQCVLLINTYMWNFMHKRCHLYALSSMQYWFQCCEHKKSKNISGNKQNAKWKTVTRTHCQLEAHIYTQTHIHTHTYANNLKSFHIAGAVICNKGDAAKHLQYTLPAAALAASMYVYLCNAHKPLNGFLDISIAIGVCVCVCASACRYHMQ